MIRRIKKYFAIRSYVRRLGPELVRRFGKKKYYTPQQVQAAVRRGGFSETDMCYAISMFCSREAFNAHHAEMGEPCNFDAMRTEVAESHFGGNADFEPATLIHHAESFSDHSGHEGHDDAGGHH
jgi:hypothetical protein